MKTRLLRLSALAVPVVAAAVAACGGRERTSSCVARGSRVLTPRGHRLVEDLVPGDEIVAFDTARCETVVRSLSGVIAGTSRALLVITSGSTRLIATGEHPFWVPERRAWIRASDLVVGDVLLRLEDGRPVPARIDEIEPRQLAEVIEVYDLVVDGPEHDFFAEDLLVHNKSIAGPCERPNWQPSCDQEFSPPFAGSTADPSEPPPPRQACIVRTDYRRVATSCEPDAGVSGRLPGQACTSGVECAPVCCGCVGARADAGAEAGVEPGDAEAEAGEPAADPFDGRACICGQCAVVEEVCDAVRIDKPHVCP